MSLRPHYVLWLVTVFIFMGSIIYLTNNRISIPTNYISEASRKFFAIPPVDPISSLPAGQNCSMTFTRTFRKWLSEYRKCLVNQVESNKKTFWNYLHAATERCLGQTMWNMLNVKLLHNWDDVKLVILPDPPTDPVTEVTLGVGNDIESEKKLRALTPNCSFYGADPILASGKVFKELGPYFEMAVSAQEGTLEASVLENGKYQSKNVSTITLVDFMKNHAKIDTVDYMFMDNEGAEYVLLWQFLRGDLLEKEKLTICQLSVELHGPFASYGINATEYENLILALINRSPLVPIWSAAPINHVRSYYLNVENKYCVEKYLQSRFCREND